MCDTGMTSLLVSELHTGNSCYVDFAYLYSITYVEVIFHSQHFFSICLCIWTRVLVNSKSESILLQLFFSDSNIFKASTEEYSKTPTFSGRQQFYSYFQNLSENSVNSVYGILKWFSCPRRIFYYICYCLWRSKKSGAVLSTSAMYMHYLRCDNLPNNGPKQLKC